MSFSIGSSGVNMGPGRAYAVWVKNGKARLRPRVVVRLLAYLQPYRGRMLGAVALMFLSTGLTLATPYLVKIAIDDYMRRRRRERSDTNRAVNGCGVRRHLRNRRRTDLSAIVGWAEGAGDIAVAAF